GIRDRNVTGVQTCALPISLVDIMLLGHWIEMRSVMGASNALEKLVKLMPNEAHKLDENNEVHDVPISELKNKDKVLVKPGEKIQIGRASCREREKMTGRDG